MSAEEDAVINPLMPDPRKTEKIMHFKEKIASGYFFRNFRAKKKFRFFRVFPFFYLKQKKIFTKIYDVNNKKCVATSNTTLFRHRIVKKCFINEKLTKLFRTFKNA